MTNGPISIRLVASAQAAEHAPALEVGPVGLAVEREEVVPRVTDVEAHRIGGLDRLADGGIRSVLGMELGGDPDRLHLACLSGEAMVP